MSRKETVRLSISGICFAIVLALVLLLKLINTAEAIQITISFVLVLVTVIYVKRTADIAKATKEQSEASVKMAEEMTEQREVASRPVIIQKTVIETETEFRNHDSKDWFYCFEVYNAGNGPAIELEISLLDKNKEQFASHRVTFLRVGDSPIWWPNRLDPNFAVDLASRDESLYYLVSEYQGIFSSGQSVKWYQTWLPFETIKTSKQGQIFVKLGQLEFKEVTEKEYIDAFIRRGKLK